MKPKYCYAAIVSLSLLFVATPPANGIWYEIPADTSIGDWDPASRTYTLTTDVYDTIWIKEGSLIFDGAGYTVRCTATYPIAPGILFKNRTGVTIKNVNVQGFSHGIVLENTRDNSVTDNTVSDSYWGGIHLIYVQNGLPGNTTVSGNTVYNNRSGIVMIHAGSNIVTGNIASNNVCGIGISSDSNNNTVIGNTTSNNDCGISTYYSNNTLTGNTSSNNTYGIIIDSSSANTLTDNTMLGNDYNFGVKWSLGSLDGFDNDIYPSNTVDGKPLYYVKNAVGQVFDSSTNAGVFYAINCDNITIRDLMLTNNLHGVLLCNTHNSTIENVTACNNNDAGILLYSSSGNILTENTITNNDGGIMLYSSSGNTLTGNMTSDNEYGIYFEGDYQLQSRNNILTLNTVASNSRGVCIRRLSQNNQVYNNNFIGNAIQASIIYDSPPHVFSLAKPVGGNFWSDWTSPDNNGDGFVDYRYYIYFGGIDYLPWAQQDGWLTPTLMIQKLITEVTSLNLQQGIENSLNARLETALQVLDDLNEANDAAAIKSLEAFIRFVEAQRGNKIPEEDADALIAAAQEIIDLLAAG